MIRNILGILFLIVSGFFVYMVSLMAFFEFPDVGGAKFLILGGICIPLLIFHLIGLAFYRGANWKISTGITFFVGAAFNILVVISILSIKYSPEIAEVVDTSGLSAFSDYLSGFVVMALFIGLGIALFFWGKAADKPGQLDTNSAA